MSVPDHQPQAADRTVDLLSALAAGDVAKDEVVSTLRRDGVDALDVLVAVVARAATASTARTTAQRPLLFNSRSSTRAEPPLPHRVPHVPVLMNGTLYDPQDIRRFDGVELHFIAAKGHLIAIDDRPLMAQWWQNSYLTTALQNYQYGGHSGVTPQVNVQVPQVPPLEPGGELPPFTQGGSGGGRPETLLYEHVDFQGDWLTLLKDRAFYDLTEVGKDFLGLGDWNDVISSVQLFGTSRCVLFEHVHAGGSSLTLQGSRDNLVNWGWNDRVSSVETW